MNTLDIILLICFIPAAIAGLRKGLVGQIIGLLTIILGCRLSMTFQKPVTDWLVKVTAANPEMIRILSFVLIFIAVAVVLYLIGKVIEKVIHIVLLGWVNKLLGILISSLIAIVVIGLIGGTVSSLNDQLQLFNPAFMKESVLLDAFMKVTSAIMPYLKSLIF